MTQGCNEPFSQPFSMEGAFMPPQSSSTRAWDRVAIRAFKSRATALQPRKIWKRPGSLRFGFHTKTKKPPLAGSEPSEPQPAKLADLTARPSKRLCSRRDPFRALDLDDARFKEPCNHELPADIVLAAQGKRSSRTLLRPGVVLTRPRAHSASCAGEAGPASCVQDHRLPIPSFRVRPQGRPMHPPEARQLWLSHLPGPATWQEDRALRAGT